MSGNHDCSYCNLSLPKVGGLPEDRAGPRGTLLLSFAVSGYICRSARLQNTKTRRAGRM